MSQTPPPVDVEPTGRSLRDRFSIVWLIPLTALVISVALAWQNYASQGPIVEITFDNASGVHANETEIRYRNVTVGEVIKVSFSADLSQVIVRARLDQEVARFVDDDASFWIVSPEVTARGITGLDTVLSGVYIEAAWDDEPDGVRYLFEGLSKPLVPRPGQLGLLIRLRTSSGEALANGTPILYRGIEVGSVSNARISRDGQSSVADAFIEEPYDELINSSTRFWDTSGFTFTIGASGADIDFQSLASLIGGGVTFDTVVAGGRPVENEQVFQLYSDETSARGSVFTDPDAGEDVQLSVVFEDNATGLAVGAPVELAGIVVGEVTGIRGVVDEDSFGDSNVRLLASISVRASRLGLGEDASKTDLLDYLEEQVNEGLRARLTAASIFTGGLKVELTVPENPLPATLDRGGIPFAILPSAPSMIQDMQATAEGVFERINNLPIEDVLESAINLLNSGTRVLSTDALLQVPDEVLGMVEDVRGVIGSDEVQALPGQIATTAGALETAAADLQTLLSALEDQDGVTRILAAVDALTATANSVTVVADELPALLDEVTVLANNVSTLDLNGVINQTTTLLGSVDDLVTSESVAAVPEELAETLSQVSTALAELRAEDGMGRIVAAVENLGSAATSIESSTAGVPQLVTEITELAENASALDLDALVGGASDVLANVATLTGTEGARALPGTLNEAVSELASALSEFRAQEGTTKLVAAIDAAGAAAIKVEEATQSLPELVDNITQLSERIRDLPLDGVVTELETFLANSATLIGTQDARDVPAALNDALLQVSAVLQELREGGTVESANEALAAAAGAAQSIEAAANRLPQLVNQLNAVLSEGQTTVASLGPNSQLSREISAALRDIQQAADAFESLARAIERRPNSLLTGR